jgi:hypothetical protein
MLSKDLIPAVEGLLPDTYDAQLLTLLYRLAEWHSLAKLRMHTDDTLNLLDESTKVLGKELRSFRTSSARAWTCKELPSEIAARQRKAERKRAKAAAKAVVDVPNPPQNLECHGATPLLDPHAIENVPPIINTPLPQPKLAPKVKTLNLFTYKFHALGDYVQTIHLFGTTDSYSTQIVCVSQLC